MKKTLLTLLLALAVSFSFATPVIIYVATDGSSSESVDGLSWANAVDLNRGKNLSNFYFAQGTDNQVWVKSGTYTLTSAFQLNSNMAFYGGFVGTETSLNERNYYANKTILNQTATAMVLFGNGTVSTGVYTDYDVLLDGFIFQGGSVAAGNSGGSVSQGTILRNCIFRNNTSGGSGILTCNPITVTATSTASTKHIVIENCLFVNNQTGGTPSLIAVATTPTDIINCTFANNLATAGTSATISIGTTGTLTMYNSIFYNNINVSSAAKAVANNTAKILRYNGWDVAATDGTLSNNIVLSSSPFVAPTSYVGSANGTTKLFSAIDEADFRLASGSSCINAGNNSYSTTSLDLANTTRIQNSTIDMGCYEKSVTTGFKPTESNGLMVAGDVVTLPENAMGKVVKIYAMNGSLLNTFTSQAATFTLQNKGLFVVKVGSEVYKIVK